MGADGSGFRCGRPSNLQFFKEIVAHQELLRLVALLESLRNHEDHDGNEK